MCRLFLFCLCIVFAAILVQGTADKEKEAESADTDKEPADKEKEPADKGKKPADKAKKPAEKETAEETKEPAEKDKEPADNDKKPADKAIKTEDKKEEQEEPADKAKKTEDKEEVPADKDEKAADKNKKLAEKSKTPGEKDEDPEDKEKKVKGEENRSDLEIERYGGFKKCPVFKATEELDEKQFVGIWIDEYHANINYICTEYKHTAGVNHVDLYAYNFTEQMHLNVSWKTFKQNGGYHSNVTHGYFFEGISPLLYCKNGCCVVASCSPDPRTGTNVVFLQILKRCDGVCDMKQVTKVLKANKIDKVPLVRGWDNEKCPRHFADKKKCKYSQA